jgi:23S rRNA (uracil1939-C5)-methyltransferase
MAGENSIVNELTAEKWVYGGEALARVPDESGESNTRRVVLVPFVLPGEIVDVRLLDALHARAERIKVASPERVAPPCALFSRCGGCHYQHAPYEYQLARKVEILREQLQRVGKIKFGGEVQVISGPPLGYRNRVQLHLEGGRIGYRAAGSHQLVPLDGECPVASPRLEKAFELLRSRMREPRFPRFVQSIELFTNESEVQVNVLESERPVAQWFYQWCESTAVIEYPAHSAMFRVSPRSFFQVNRFLIDRLIDEALTGAAGGSALDLYAGVGLFAVPLARQFASVAAVEAGATAARDLQFNAQRAGVTLESHQARVEDYLAKLDTKAHAVPDFVLADPPRTGLGKTVTQHLERLAPPRITVVSCDPATLARDLAALRSYRIERLTLVDLFPQTYHLETVAHLARD